MFKKLFLRRKSKRNNGSSLEHCTYSNALRIGVLYNSQEYAQDIIADLIANLQGDDKEVESIGFAIKSMESSAFFSKRDISNTGTFKKESLQYFVNKPFDFLISLDSSENMNYRFVLALSKAKCKLGIESQEYYELLHMALKKCDHPADSARSVVKYLKMI